MPNLASAAEEATAAARKAVKAGRARDARDLIVTAGVAIDKAQLLSGAATSRADRRSVNVSVDLSDVGSSIDREIAELTERLGLAPDGDPDEVAGLLDPDGVVDAELVDP